MSRIQILPLTPERVGDVERIPFILILDRIEDISPGECESLRVMTGAKAVIVSADDWDAPGALNLTDEQRDTLTAYLTQPLRVALGTPTA